MLACAHPAFDGPVILFQIIIDILYGAVLAILRKGTFGLEPDDRGWITGVIVGVDDPRRRMILPSQRFSQKALCCVRVLLGRKKEVDDALVAYLKRARPASSHRELFLDGKRRFTRSVARSASAPSFKNCSGAPEFPYTDRAPMCCAIVWRRKWSLEAVRSKRLPMC